MPGLTPIFQMPYPVDLDPAADIAPTVQTAIERVEAVMRERAIVPGLGTLNDEIGARQTADLALDARLDVLEADRVTPWLDYVPRFTGGGTFAEGATTASKGRYHRVGTTVTGTFYIATSTGFVQGTGPFRFTAPIPGRAPAAGSPIVGTAWMWQSGNAAVAAIRQVSTTQFEMVIGGATPQVGSGVPWAWGVNNEITAQFVYEVPAP